MSLATTLYSKVYEPTSQYFDANRDKKPITEIKLVNPADNCEDDPGFEDVDNLFNW